MNFIISEEQQNQAILNYLDKRYHPDKLDKEVHDIFNEKYIEYSINGKTIMIWDKESDIVLLDYEVFILPFKHFYKMSPEEYDNILNIWLNKNFTPKIKTKIRYNIIL